MSVQNQSDQPDGQDFPSIVADQPPWEQSGEMEELIDPVASDSSLLHPAGTEESAEKKQPTKYETSTVNIVLILIMFVICGTGSVITSKVMYQTHSEGLHGDRHLFKKPLFQNLSMFIGMGLCLLIYEVNKAMGGYPEEEGRPRDWRVYYYVAAPATCDFIATQMMNVGLLWVSGSIWQMLRGSIVLFAALIRWKFLKRQIFNFQWFGVSIVICALAFIGTAGVEGGSDVVKSSSGQKLLGVGLVVAAQVVQAAQTVIEEFLMHDIQVADLMIVGLEGCWGLFYCLAILVPVEMHMPGEEGNGVHENTHDTLVQLSNSTTIQVLFVIYCLVILGLNTFGMKVTKYTNSVTRNILDTMRTIFIWGSLTFIHYKVDDGLGERWTNWGFMELVGFALLVFGIFVYNDVVRLDRWFDYPRQKKKRDPLQSLPPPRLGDGEEGEPLLEKPDTPLIGGFIHPETGSVVRTPIVPSKGHKM